MRSGLGVRGLVFFAVTLTAALAWPANVDTQHYQPAPTLQGLNTVRGGAADAPWDFTLSGSLSYARDPVVFADDHGKRLGSLVSNRVDFVMAYALGIPLGDKVSLVRGIDLAAVLPFVPFIRGSRLTDHGLTANEESSAGTGDVRLEARVQLVSQKLLGVDVSILPVVTLPTSVGSRFAGSASAVFAPELAASTNVGPLFAAMNLGYRLRKSVYIGDLPVRDQVSWRAGAALDLGMLNIAKNVSASVEGFGLTQAKAPFKRVRQSPVELVGSVRDRLGDFVLSGGLGSGLGTGYGAPAYRLLVGAAWAPRSLDRDGDGVPDKVDGCPDVAEDPDAFEDGDGCPEADNDKDGLLDEADACPDQAEDKDGFADEDGCPDADNDNDGVLDATDKCPLEAEDKDGYQDDDGCAELDNDGDGVLEPRDKCPSEPEDKDGFEDQDGCPDTDNDKDGILDDADKCPLQAEDKNGYQDDDGCPDAKNDKDGDGLNDKVDKCPKDPEDKDGFEDDDGCPDLDNDKDTVPDTTDSCPNEPEDKDAFMDEDGCPEEDNDGDGIWDQADKCPNEPETINGTDDADGCPDQGSQLVELKATKIEIRETVRFKTGSDELDSASFNLLDQVAALLANHGKLRIRVEGHTDDQGADAFNLDLSNRRAASVRKYLIGKGIGGERLESVGHGEEMPIASNKTARGREMNRRVEFNIIEENAAAPTGAAPPAAAPPPPAKPQTAAPQTVAPQAATPPAAAPAAAAPASADTASYTLKKAQSLNDVSSAFWKTAVHAEALLHANPDAAKVDQSLPVGTVLHIPRSVTYTVKRGDTLDDIAKKLLGKSKYAKYIIEASKAVLPDASKLDVGMVLTIPLVNAESEKLIGP